MEQEIAKFREIFVLVNKDIAKAKRYLAKTDLSMSYKKILKAFTHYRKRNLSKILTELENCTCSNDFQKAMKSYILGLAYNHHGKYAFAIEHLSHSHEQLKSISINVEDFKFNVLSILLITSFNRNYFQKVLQAWKMLEPISSYSNNSFFTKIQCQALMFISQNKSTEAEELILKTLDQEQDRKGYELFASSFIMLMISSSIAEANLDKCAHYIEKYKSSKGFVVKANYLFMKLMITHIQEDSALYVYQRDFKDSIELYQQLEVIKCLSEGDFDGAKQFWEKLSLHNKEIYQADFEYKGGKNLFSIALDKHLNEKSQNKIDMLTLESLESPFEKISYILENATAPINKHDLVELIWNEESNEVSLSRLRKLITRYRRNSKFEVISKQGNYHLKIS